MLIPKEDRTKIHRYLFQGMLGLQSGIVWKKEVRERKCFNHNRQGVWRVNYGYDDKNLESVKLNLHSRKLFKF